MHGLGFRLHGLGLRVHGLGFKVYKGAWFRVWGGPCAQVVCHSCEQRRHSATDGCSCIPKVSSVVPFGFTLYYRGLTTIKLVESPKGYTMEAICRSYR